MIFQRKLNCLIATFGLVFTLFFVYGCSKKSSDTTTTTPKTKTQLITSHTWMYDEYFRNYNTNSTALCYKRGKSNNLLNLDPNRVTFRTDGSYTEITETGTTINGTWKFLNNETQTQTISTAGTFSSTIVLLDDSHFIWYDPTQSSGTYGKMISQ